MFGQRDSGAEPGDGLDNRWTPGRTETTVRRSRSWPALIIVAASLLLMLGALIASSGNGEATDDAVTTVPTTLTPSTTFAPTTAPPPDYVPLIVRVGETVRVVVRSSNGRVELLTISPNGDAEARVLPSFGRYRFDAGGVTLSVTGDTDADALWAGPVDGDLSLLASGVVAHAWHDRDPGRLAFQQSAVDAAAPATVTWTTGEDAGDEAGSEQFDAPLDARLRAWGDWGFLFDRPPDGSDAAVAGVVLVSADGRVRLESEGVFLGLVGEHAIVRWQGGVLAAIDLVAETASLVEFEAATVLERIVDVPDSDLFVAEFESDGVITIGLIDWPGFGERIRLVDAWPLAVSGSAAVGNDGSFVVFSTDGAGEGSEIGVIALGSSGPGRRSAIASYDDGVVVETLVVVAR